jgi:hypothetical protein
MHRSFSLATIAEARAAVEYFNAFHDGFIRQLQVLSHDRFTARGEHHCSGRLDLVVRFAHYNYDFEHGLRAHTQEVEAEFHGVRDLSAQFSGRETEWSVKWLEITAATRAKTYPPSEQEPCLRAVLVQPRLRDWKEWLEHEDLAFTFTGGSIRELPSQ